MSSSLNYIQPHVKIFFIMIIISVTFLIIWRIIKPTNTSTILGVVPFPKVMPNIPPDSTQCGTTPIEANLQIADPCNVCIENDGKNNYKPVTIPNNQEVWYLGTKLQPGKTYCLPKQAENKINNCGTYTSRAVFENSAAAGGNEWTCECLYPNFYDGDSCINNKVCVYESDDIGDFQYGNLVDKDGKAWNPLTNNIVNTTPYATDALGNPKFKCGIDGVQGKAPPGYYVSDLLPYTFQKDICYAGQYSTPDAYFNPTTNECECKEGVIKTNVSGFCFPPNNQNCKQHPVTGGCTFGIDILNSGNPLLFKVNVGHGVKAYASLKGVGNYTVLVDLDGSYINTSTIDDLSTTQAKDSFNAYPIYTWDQLDPKQQGLIHQATSSSAIAIINKNMMGDSNNNQILPGVGIPCNSYFNQTPGLPNCDTITVADVSNADNTMLNKTGYVFNNLFTPNCKATGGCLIDITKPGYQCECKIGGQRLNTQTGNCQNCLPDGTLSALYDPSLCCSERIHENAASLGYVCGEDQAGSGCVIL